MADMPPLSSQETAFFEENKIDIDGPENMASSPSRPQSSSGHLSSTQKIKKPPTVTPKRFTKFFTPRNTTSTRGGRQSKAGRQLQDITKNGANLRRGALQMDSLSKQIEDDVTSDRPIKRRKYSTYDLPSSPPQTSPLRHVQTVRQFEVFEDEAVLSPVFSEADSLPTFFPKPIRRLREPGPSRRLLERSFGGFSALSRGRRGPDHVADVRAATANFATTPRDIHPFRGAALPFCTASCNTNSLIAVGDEEGSVRLIDSSPSSDFGKTHVRFRVHHNAVMDVTFSPDDYVLATSSGDQTARVVDMQTQQTMCILTGHKSSVKQVRFKPGDDNMITTSARDGTVLLWDLRCGGKSAVQNFRASLVQSIDSDGKRSMKPEARYSQQELEVGYGHCSSHRKFDPMARNELSITSFHHLPPGREHLIITSSEVDASVKLWDLRNAGRRNPVPLSSTPLPASHAGTRNYGINSMALSGDGGRLYTICRDATVYAYSTSQLVLGYAPEMSSAPSRRRMLKEPKAGLAPLYGFKHPQLRVGSFYIKASLRPAKGAYEEMLAVGSTDKCPILFPTDERYLPRRCIDATRPQEMEEDDNEDDDEMDLDLPTLPLPSSQASKRSNSVAQAPGRGELPVYKHGSALVRAHNKEVTSLAWTTEGNLVSVSDDFTARCWREDANTARELRRNGEAGGGRWRSGWAEVDADWDEEDC